MSWTLSTSGASILKAGANANSTITASGAALDLWSDECESALSLQTRYDWVTNYGIINANFKKALSDVVSSMVAIRIINYDMSGFTSRQEATTMLDVNADIINKNMNALNDDKNKEKMGV